MSSSLVTRLRGRQAQRRRTPTVLQMEAAECGAACLGMVLGHFGRHVPLEELRTACGVSRDGSKASGILRAARAYGLESKGLKAEPSHLHDLRPPLVAFVNFSHFVVVEGIGPRWVYLNDPASGPRRVGHEEFDEMFTGVVLTFRTTPEFVRSDARPSRLRRLRERIRPVRAAMLFVGLLTVALFLPGVAIPLFSRTFVDYVLIASLEDWLQPLLIGMAVTALLRGGLTWLRAITLARLETQLSIAGARQMLWRLLRLPSAFFAHRFAGEIAPRVNLNDEFARLVTGDLARAVLGLISMMFYFVVMLFFDVTLTLMVAAVAGISFILLVVVTRALQNGYRKLSIDRGRLNGIAVSGIQDMETFKAAGAEDSFFTRWAGHHAKVVNTEQKVGLPVVLVSTTPAFATALTSAAVLVVGGHAVMEGTMTIGMLVAFQTLAASFSEPVADLTKFGTQVQQVQAHAARIDDILHQPQDPALLAAPTGVPPALPVGRIELEDIRFGYAPLDPPLIEGLSLALEPGTSVALVGSSGSGKSTIGRLIAGLYRPDGGRILIDGRPLEDWPRQAIAATFAYVDQEIVLFEGTVRENLTLWDSTIPESDVVAAAQDAQIHDVIASRPGGYDSVVEEGGRNFSGGQRQRLEIARALAANPRILVLDEATSALDPVSEAQVMEAVRRRGCTCVIIAHRLSTIRDCDEIVVLERGQPVERGRHPDLIAADGRYRRLVET